MAQINLGRVVGANGTNGKDGINGINGTDGVSPTIDIKTNTDTEYVLTITDAEGVFDTPNLKGSQGASGTNGTNGQNALINGVNTLNIVGGTNVSLDQVGDTLTINSSGEIAGTVDYANVVTETEPLINVDFVKLRYADASSSITVDGTSIDVIAPNGVVSGFSTSAFNVVPFTLYCLNAEKFTSASQLNLIYTSTETGTSKQKTLLGNPLQYPNVYLTFNPDSISDIDRTKTMFLDFFIQDNSGGATYKITNFTLRDDSLKIYPNIKTNLLDSLKSLDIASRGSAENLSMMLLGDSLTAAQGDSGWHYYTSQLLNIYDVTNVAMGGATLRDKEGTVYDGNPDINNPTNNTIGNQVQKIINNAYPEPDIIIMGIGLNDMSSFAEGIEDFTDAELTGTYYDSSFQKIPLENVDKKTTVGAFRYATETLHNLYPNAVIIINSESNTNQTERDPLLVMKYAERFEKLSLFASLPFINTKRCGINWANEFPWESPDQPGEYLYDGLHHTRKAAKLYGAFMASHIREFVDMVKYMKAL